MIGAARDGKIRVLFWATTFGADMASFARYLDSHPGYSIMIAMKDPDTFRNEGIQRLLPITAPILDREKERLKSYMRILRFKPHVLVVDNHFPPIRFAKRLLVLWHGYGWRHDNMVREFEAVHHNITRIAGDGRVPNPNLIWQCYGPPDVDYRTRVSGFARENLRDLGFAQADDLVRPPVTREQLAPFYSMDILRRPTVLMGFTWHHGRLLSHWGEEREVLGRLISLADDLGINLLFRMHDSFRYPEQAHRELRELSRGRDNIMIKFKDSYPDNLGDILVSDIAVSDFSSLINRFYVTRRPSIHIFPDQPEDRVRKWRKLGSQGTVEEEVVDDVSGAWKFPPRWNGGLMVHSFGEFEEALRLALDRPDCCREPSERFIREGLTGVDGRTCERTERALRDLVNGRV